MSSRLLLIAMVVLLTRQAACEDEVQGSPWPKVPVRKGASTGKDKAAREELLDLIERRQDVEYRKQYKVAIPDQPSGLPREYDLLLYGKYLKSSLQRFEVKVRGDKAILEVASSKEIRRGEIAKDQIDAIARQLIYGHMAEEFLRNPNELTSRLGGSWASHSPEMTFEIISQEKDVPFHLRTKAHQLLGRSVDIAHRGVQGCVETRSADQLRRLYSDHLPVVEPDDAAVRDLIRRLKYISDDKIEQKDASYSFRDDLSAVEALLYGKLAVTWRAKEALSQLRRLKLADSAEQLRVATMENPVPELEKLIRGKDWQMFLWALDFATNLSNPKHVDVVVNSLTQVDEQRVGMALEALNSAELTQSQLAVIAAFHGNAQRNTFPRIAAAKLLLVRNHQDQFYLELMEIALTARKKPHYSAVEVAAIQGVLSYSVDSGRKRKESVELVRSLLDELPEGNRLFVERLGQLGDRDDLPRLRSYCQKGNYYLTSQAIQAIAHIDPIQGHKLALQQIDSLNENEVEPRWHVQAYLELLFWRRDPSAIKPLEVTLAKSSAHDDEDLNWIPQLEQLLQYLKSQDVKERLAIALKFDRNYLDQAWRADIGRQLIAHGADPKACEVFLKPLPKPNWRLR